MMAAMSIDPLAPYGPLVTSTARVVTWNVWGRAGDWERRFDRIAEAVAEADPDLVALQEVWRADGTDITAELGRRLGLASAAALRWFEPTGADSGVALLSRWPIVATHEHYCEAADGGDGAVFQHARIDGPRGRIDATVVMLDWRPDLSHVRHAQARELADFVTRHVGARSTTIVCGDFNAAPDTDEVRALTGRAAVVRPGFVLQDAWEMAGGPEPGHTWSNRNHHAAAALLSDRRIDYVFSVWPRAGGRGHAVRCGLLGDGEDPPSDHFGVVADLRY